MLTIGGIVVVQNLWDLTKSDWASWAQAIGTVAAVIGAFLVARYQIATGKHENAALEQISHGKDLLALQHLAAELAQMCVLANFEKSNYVEQTIYPDAAMEFRNVADMLSKFPVVTVVALGEMETVLHLRRIAIKAALIFERDRDIKGDAFVLRHRAVFATYRTECQQVSIRLQTCVNAVAPEQFTNKLRTHL
ncbi:hypothetical protein [Paraburkholderia sp. BCC1884]|uniref:hypothetical protein n=1 Tax=Paraburkholderia sp. BCC1884 TaxID=2562668 RepID=UPI00118387EF|nr:hypothetical protein [Paraburkholderia sp. BCC1884]